jgi:hypothetical protein
MPEGTVFSSEPKRILVQTKTHLVPGKDFHEKLMFMLDRICQHHWRRDYDLDQDRWSTHGCRFGYHNKTCYFLLDNGVSSNDDKVEVLQYLFSGIEEPLLESLCPGWYSRLTNISHIVRLFQDLYLQKYKSSLENSLLQDHRSKNYLKQRH